jgi:hypothetical protein
VLKALVGDVVVEAQKAEGKARPEMIARFTINAIPALAMLNRGRAGKSDDPTVNVWEFLNTDRGIMLGKVSTISRTATRPPPRPFFVCGITP